MGWGRKTQQRTSKHVCHPLLIGDFFSLHVCLSEREVEGKDCFTSHAKRNVRAALKQLYLFSDPGPS